MSNEVTPEVVDHEIEVLPPEDLNKKGIDAMIRFAENAERFGKALDTNRKFALGRAWIGDFVQHGEKVNITGPGAERIISAYAQMGVSVSFNNWGYKKDTGSDKNGEWLTWWYYADVEIGGFRSRIEGRAGTRDEFFGKAHGAFKDLADIKESDIRMAARRCVFKEAVKVAFGLRSIPAEMAESLGLDPAKIKKVEFGKTGAGDSGSAPAAAKTPLGIKHVGQRKITKKDKTTGVVYVVEDERGAKYETFSETIAKAATDIWKSGKKALLDWEPNGNFAPKLNAISEAKATEVDGGGSFAPGDAQEPA